jgi:hypothetical protein
MPKRNLKLCVPLLLCLPLFLFPAYGQEKQKVDPFADVPQSLRARLADRLGLLVEYHRVQQWDKMYELLGEQFKNSIEGGMSKERWLRDHPHYKLSRFTPKRATLLSGTPENGYWIIRGCGEYSRFGPNEKLESSVEAYRQNGDWFFSSVGIQFPCIHCAPKGCRH